MPASLISNSKSATSFPPVGRVIPLCPKLPGNAITEAVAIYRELAAAHPDAFRPGLASSLNNQSGGLAALGRREDALAASEEAVDLHRELAAAHPDAFRPDLAGSLNNQSNRLAALGRREDALAAITEAVDLYRELAARLPEFRESLAWTLTSLRIRLTEKKDFDEALSANREAALIYAALLYLDPG